MRPQVQADTLLIGIRTGGVWVAERLNRLLGMTQRIGIIDVSFYRDDFQSRGLHASVKPSHIPFSVDDAEVVLVDDVLYTGRTIRAALNQLFDYGRPGGCGLRRWSTAADASCRWRRNLSAPRWQSVPMSRLSWNAMRPVVWR